MELNNKNRLILLILFITLFITISFFAGAIWHRLFFESAEEYCLNNINDICQQKYCNNTIIPFNTDFNNINVNINNRVIYGQFKTI